MRLHDPCDCDKADDYECVVKHGIAGVQLSDRVDHALLPGDMACEHPAPNRVSESLCAREPHVRPFMYLVEVPQVVAMMAKVPFGREDADGFEAPERDESRAPIKLLAVVVVIVLVYDGL